MKRILSTIITLLFITNYLYSQQAMYVKRCGFEGYIFPAHLFLGNSPEKNRYTPCIEDITQAEKILKDYLKSNNNENLIFPINKRTLKKYTRQYVGYFTYDGEIIIRINLFDRKKLEENQSPALNIIPLLGYCCIQINITTKKISNWEETR